MKRKKSPVKKETALAVIEKPKEISVWSKSEEIRKLFAPTLTETEFNMFMGLGRALNANPFTREIWAVKYDAGKAASIFCGRDFYRRKAQEQPSYDGHTVEVIYEEDDFKMIDGEPHHSFNLKTRKKILGAYCIVRRKGIKQPYVAMVKMSEYDKGFSNWQKMPETMIKKVAEAQGLRGAFQGLFAGTYDESEQWEAEKKTEPIIDRIPEFYEAAIKRISESKTPDQAMDVESRAIKLGKFSEDQLKEIHIAVSSKVDALAVP